MALDLFLAVLMPMRHKFWHRGPYLLALCAPPCAFAALAVFIENIYVTHDPLLFCTVSLGELLNKLPSLLNSFSAIPRTIRFWGTLIIFFTVLLATFLISLTAFKVHLTEKKVFLRNLSNYTLRLKCSEVKLLKSLVTLIVVFIFCWTSSLVLFHVSLYFDTTVTYQVHKYTVGDKSMRSPHISVPVPPPTAHILSKLLRHCSPLPKIPSSLHRAALLPTDSQSSQS